MLLVARNVFFAASLLVIVVLIPTCECNVNVNSDYPVQQKPHQPINLEQYTDQQQKISPSPSSPPPEAPRRIGLDINGRVKSLLWSNPKASIDSGLTPLFSSPFDDGDQTESKDLITQVDGGVDNIMNEETPQRKASLLLPSAVYGTADYRFRKERWYGLEKIGMIFQWNAPLPNKENRIGSSFLKDLRSRWLPNKLDIAVHRSIFPTSKPDSKEDFTSLVDSGNVRIGWKQNDGGETIGAENTNPWIQVGFDSQFTPSHDCFRQVESSEPTKNPLHLSLFLPLIRRRFDLQWTSRWNNFSANDNNDSGRVENGMREQWSSKHKGPNEDPWWVPQVSLDPSTGTLSSNNRYRDQFLGQENRQYLTEFKLRIRTTMPTLLSSVTNNVMGTADEDEDLQAASVRLECSLMTDPVRKGNISCGPTCTTARFETIIVPSFWLRSVTETAKIGLIHEQNHVTNS